jgi:hypothetical protein
VWSNGVIVTPPCLDQHPCLGEAVEDLAVEQLVAKRTVEALVIAVLPWRARCDVQRLHADPAEPFLNRGSDELAAIVRPDMRWRTPRDEQLGKRRQHVFVFQLTCDGQRQALPAGLVDDREDPELAPVVRSRFDTVVRPDTRS